MSYIGQSPVVGNFQVCDAISVVNNQAAYTMQVGGANVLPESANHMLVSLNGILQKPNGSFTISGSTITFSANLVTGDVINFIQILGSVLDLGVPSDATVSTAKIVDGAVTSAKLASGVGGKVLQVVSTPKTDTFSTSSTSFTDITGLSVAITPSATSSKILVMMDVVGGSGANISMFLRLMRNTTAIHVGTDVGNRIASTAGASDDPSNQFSMSMTGTVLDSPSSTSAVTYKVQMSTEGSGNTGTCFINRSGEDTDSNQGGRYTSSITVMEIGA